MKSFALAGVVCFFLVGCGTKGESPSGGKAPAVVVAQSPAAEVQSDSAPAVEHVFFGPQIGVDQVNGRLKNLFNSEGHSNLCGPTSLAHELFYQAYDRANPATGLRALLPQSTDRNAALVATTRDLAKRCSTDAVNGTLVRDLVACIKDFYAEAKVPLAAVKWITPFDVQGADEVRKLTVDDIRDTLKAGKSLIMNVAWYRWDADEAKWIHEGGHYVDIYGYDYDPADAQKKITLRVFDPYESTTANTHLGVYKVVEMREIVKKDGTELGEYYLRGPGFVTINNDRTASVAGLVIF